MAKQWVGVLLTCIFSLVGWQVCFSSMHPNSSTVGNKKIASTSPILLAVGAQEPDEGTSSPLLIQSIDGGQNWNLVNINDTSNHNRAFNSASCTSDGKLCIAAGATNGGVKGLPLLAESIDRGQHWNIVKLKGFSIGDRFETTNCSGVGSNARCFVFGEKDNFSPLLVQTTDGGKSWNTINLNGASMALMNASYCSGSGDKTHCLAVGGWSINNFHPFILRTIDGGQHWNFIDINNMPLCSYLYSINCARDGKVCIAIVGGASKHGALLAQSTDGGQNWNFVDTKDMPNRTFYGAVCFDGSDAVHCIASGSRTDDNTPLLEESVDGGKNWSAVNINDIPIKATTLLGPISCFGSGNGTRCIIRGVSQGGNSVKPFLVETINGGQTWFVENIPAIPNISLLFGISCAGVGATAHCIAAGGFWPDGQKSYAPLLVQSLDGGSNWYIPQIPGLINKKGAFNSVASSGGTTAAEFRSAFSTTFLKKQKY